MNRSPSYAVRAYRAGPFMALLRGLRSAGYTVDYGRPLPTPTPDTRTRAYRRHDGSWQLWANVRHVHGGGRPVVVGYAYPEEVES